MKKYYIIYESAESNYKANGRAMKCSFDFCKTSYIDKAMRYETKSKVMSAIRYLKKTCNKEFGFGKNNYKFEALEVQK